MPRIVFYHGGGFIAGSMNVYDKFCTWLASENDAVAVSVDYRLAPENPFPAAFDDAYAALAYVNSHADVLEVDGSNITVAGKSVTLP